MHPWWQGALLGFDLETTGADPSVDLPVQAALVQRRGDGSFDRDVFLVDPGRPISPGAVAVHRITDDVVRRSGRALEEASRALHATLLAAEEMKTPVVIMNAGFDATIAERLFHRFGLPSLAWSSVIDPLVLDRHLDRFRRGKRQLGALCERYGVVHAGPHDAGSDAEAVVELARSIAERYPDQLSHDAEELTLHERRWHRSWAEEFGAWQERRGSGPVDPADFAWPVREIAALGERGRGGPG
jgi:DNA polymerase-3 subunit epsilon